MSNVKDRIDYQHRLSRVTAFIHDHLDEAIDLNRLADVAWLALSGEEVEDAPVFEEYLNNPREVSPQDLMTDIYLPLK
jgi:hypothetical protein